MIKRQTQQEIIDELTKARDTPDATVAIWLLAGPMRPAEPDCGGIVVGGGSYTNGDEVALIQRAQPPFDVYPVKFTDILNVEIELP